MGVQTLAIFIVYECQEVQGHSFVTEGEYLNLPCLFLPSRQAHWNPQRQMVIKDLGTNKSPGPDGFTAEVLEKYWNIIKKIDAFMVSDYRPISSMPCLFMIVASLIRTSQKDTSLHHYHSTFVEDWQILDERNKMW